MKNFKDNPVPSLDDEVNDIILDLDNAQYYGATPDLCQRAIALISKLHKQNGVETNKEQPSKNCNCANQSQIGCHGDCVY